MRSASVFMALTAALHGRIQGSSKIWNQKKNINLYWVKKSANTSAGTTAGPELAVSTLKAAAEAPEKPEAVSRTDTEIRLKAVQGQEYAAVSKENISAEWNDTGIFSIWHRQQNIHLSPE